MDGWEFLRISAILILYIVMVHFIFNSLFALLFERKSMYKYKSISNTFIKTMWFLGVFVWVLWILKEMGLSDVTFGVFTGTGVVVIATYFYAYLQTSDINYYIKAMLGKNYEEGDYIIVYDKDSIIAEGQVMGLTMRNLVLLPYREQSLVQIPTPNIVSKAGYTIKNMDYGNYAMYKFSIIANLDADISAITKIVLDKLGSVDDIVSEPVPWAQLNYEDGHYKIDYVYYCVKKEAGKSAYLVARNVFVNLSFDLVEHLRSAGHKIGLTESVWLNGTYNQDTSHLKKEVIEKRIKNKEIPNINLAGDVDDGGK